MTRDLVESLTRRGTKGSVSQTFPKRMIFGTSLKYASFHQDPSPGSDFPRRDSIVVTKKMLEKVGSHILDHIAGEKVS